MKISQIVENAVDFEKDLKQHLVDVIVFFKATGVTKTTVDNLKKELKATGINIATQQLEDELNNLDYEIIDNQVVINQEDNEEEIAPEESDEESEAPSDNKKLAMKQALK